MATYALTQERPVMTRQLVGRMPNDSYVQNQPFVPNVPAANAGEQEVYEQAPELDAGGGLKIRRQTVQVEAEPYSPTLRGLTSGLISATTAALVGGLTGGIPGAVAGGLTAMIAGATLGNLTARHDQVSLVTTEQTITTPVMTGYRMSSVDEAFTPTKGKGTLHYATPVIEQRPVGILKSDELIHSAMGPEKAALCSAALGVAIGLACGYLPVPVIT